MKFENIPRYSFDVFDIDGDAYCKALEDEDGNYVKYQDIEDTIAGMKATIDNQNLVIDAMNLVNDNSEKIQASFERQVENLKKIIEAYKETERLLTEKCKLQERHIHDMKITLRGN